MDQFRTPFRGVVFAVACVVLVGVVDYATGYEIGVFVFYFVPIAIAAWEAGMAAGTAVALLSAAAWFLSDYWNHAVYSSDWIRWWNAFVRFLSFIIVAYSFSQIRSLLARALGEIKTLSGLLPICSSCKKIRNDQGYWQQLEEYIRQRTDAEFSHGLCGECAEKFRKEAGLGPEVLKRPASGRSR